MKTKVETTKSPENYRTIKMIKTLNPISLN